MCICRQSYGYIVYLKMGILIVVNKAEDNEHFFKPFALVYKQEERTFF